MEDSIPISEHDANVLEIKSEIAKAHVEFLEAKGAISKRML